MYRQIISAYVVLETPGLLTDMMDLRGEVQLSIALEGFSRVLGSGAYSEGIHNRTPLLLGRPSGAQIACIKHVREASSSHSVRLAERRYQLLASSANQWTKSADFSVCGDPFAHEMGPVIICLRSHDVAMCPNNQQLC